MIRADRRARQLAYVLSALAGYVDAVGFLMIGGLFVSFMSGNTTRMAVGIFEHASDWQRAVALIGSFVIGVVAGSLVGRTAARRHRAILSLVSLMLAFAGGLALADYSLSAALCMAFAMGAENATFERDGEVQIGLTYMTGTLVKAGQRIAGALTGGERDAWLPYATLWLALALGAVAGALAHHVLGRFAIWPGVAIALGAAFASSVLDDRTVGEAGGD